MSQWAVRMPSSSRYGGSGSWPKGIERRWPNCSYDLLRSRNFARKWYLKSDGFFRETVNFSRCKCTFIYDVFTIRTLLMLQLLVLFCFVISQIITHLMINLIQSLWRKLASCIRLYKMLLKITLFFSAEKFKDNTSNSTRNTESTLPVFSYATQGAPER